MGNNIQSALSLLGMARRAGKLQVGTERCSAAVKSGHAALAVTCTDLSAKSKKETDFLCDKHSVAVIHADFTIAELSGAIGTKAGLIAVCDQGFAKRLKVLLTAKRED